MVSSAERRPAVKAAEVPVATWRQTSCEVRVLEPMDLRLVPAHNLLAESVPLLRDWRAAMVGGR